MPDSPQACCAVHGTPLLLAPDGTGVCPACAASAAPRAFPASPMGPLAQQAVMNHEMVATYQAAGFSRPEAMQVLCCIIQAGIMRGSGGG